MLISTKNRFIKYLSRPYGGRRHDFHLLKQEFPPELPWFENCTIRVDSGYTGIVNNYRCKSISIPHKKSKNKPLTSEQKTINKQFASERIFVEHSIAGLKRFRILSDRLRIHNFDLYDKILGVCAGLWNFNLAN
ncbi:transposase [Rhodoferax sp. 4810]|uniref:Transposase n=1 Tax=Thiospirillum jenense TaxID=1653858 RepID=A0A839HBW0_9GAMM|nr:transposase [Rhodoferax jenense]MBB1126044.1 transposase [Thiospirillum jenense]